MYRRDGAKVLVQNCSTRAASLAQIDHILIAAPRPSSSAVCQRFDVRAADQDINVGEDFTDGRLSFRFLDERLQGVAAVTNYMLATAPAKFLNERKQAFSLCEGLPAENADAVALETGVK